MSIENRIFPRYPQHTHAHTHPRNNSHTETPHPQASVLDSSLGVNRGDGSVAAAIAPTGADAATLYVGSNPCTGRRCNIEKASGAPDAQTTYAADFVPGRAAADAQDSINSMAHYTLGLLAMSNSNNNPGAYSSNNNAGAYPNSNVNNGASPVPDGNAGASISARDKDYTPITLNFKGKFLVPTVDLVANKNNVINVTNNEEDGDDAADEENRGKFVAVNRYYHFQKY